MSDGEDGTAKDWSYTSHVRADLRGVDLSGADLRRAIFDGADLEGADLSAAVLEHVSPPFEDIRVFFGGSGDH